MKTNKPKYIILMDENQTEATLDKFKCVFNDALKNGTFPIFMSGKFNIIEYDTGKIIYPIELRKPTLWQRIKGWF